MLRKRGVQVEWCEGIDTTGTSATIKSPRDRQQEVGIVLDGRGRKRRHISTAEDVP